MKIATLGMIGLLALPGWGRGATFTVHEWGTFTTVHAPNGDLLPGLQREEEPLPNFVHSHDGFAPADKGWSRPVANVTVKMETPVLYVYSDAPFRLRAEVGFVGGSISQWYPERTAGETLPPARPGEPTVPVDFATGFHGSVVWETDVLAPGVAPRLAHPDWETSQWPRARVANANTLRGPTGEEEGFLFYRGVGNFALPVRITTDAQGAITVENTGTETIPYLLAYERATVGADVYVREAADLRPRERRVLPARAKREFHSRFLAALRAAGLTEAEASAMLATWKESYFEREGLRLFWIVPRGFVDRILPLRLEPVPKALERVLVGRSELVTPALAAEIERGFRADGGAAWGAHRYFLAYRELAARRGVVLPAIPATLP